MLGLDKKSIKLAKALLESGNMSDSTRESLKSMVDWYSSHGFFTSSQRGFVKSILAQSKERDGQRVIVLKAADMLKTGEVPMQAIPFVTDVIDFFETKGFLTIIQQEHLEKITRGGEDPSDEEIKVNEDKLKANFKKNTLTSGYV
jgi:hypothetical protein